MRSWPLGRSKQRQSPDHAEQAGATGDHPKGVNYEEDRNCRHRQRNNLGSCYSCVGDGPSGNRILGENDPHSWRRCCRDVHSSRWQPAPAIRRGTAAIAPWVCACLSAATGPVDQGLGDGNLAIAPAWLVKSPQVLGSRTEPKAGPGLGLWCPLVQERPRFRMGRGLLLGEHSLSCVGTD